MFTKPEGDEQIRSGYVPAERGDSIRGLGIVLAALILLILLVFSFALYSYPPPLSDSIVYLPTAINVTSKHSLTNEVLNWSYKIPFSHGRFIYSLSFFPLFLGAIMGGCGTPQQAFLVLALMNALTLCLSLRLFCKAALCIGKGWTLQSQGLVLAALVGLSTSFTGHMGGRPECLAIFLVSLSVVIHIRYPKIYLPGLYGVFLGLSGAAFPVSGIFGFIFIAMYFSIFLIWKKVMTAMVQVLIFSITVFITVQSFSPYTLQETLAGVLMHSHYALSYFTRGMIVSYFFYANIYCYGFVFIVALWCAARLTARHFYRIQSRFLFIVFCMMFAAAFYIFSIRVSNHLLNVLPFFPLFLSLIIYYALRHASRLTIVLLITVLLGACVNFLRITVLFPYALSRGVSLETARAAFESFRLRHPQFTKYGISDALWVLAEDYENMVMCQTSKEQCDTDNPKMAIVWQQAGSGLLKPPQSLMGYVLKENYFVAEEPRLFGLRLGATVPGYGYAIYVPPTTD